MSEAELWREIEALKRQLEELKTRERIGSSSSGALVATRVVYVATGGLLTTEAGFEYIEGSDELRAGRYRAAEQGTPTTPASGFSLAFPGSAGDNNGIWSCVDDAGVVYQMVRYVTGTFTPALAGSGTAGTFTYDTGNTEAQYTRIGDRVFFNGRIIITATSVAPTGNLSITGLALTAGANGFNGNILGGCSVGYSGLNLAAGYTQVEGWITGGATSILLYEMGDNVARAIVQGGELAATSDFFFSGWYKVD